MNIPKSGTGWMFESIIKMLPPELIANIAQVAQISITVKAQLDRLEKNQQAIMAHFGIELPEYAADAKADTNGIFPAITGGGASGARN